MNRLQRMIDRLLAQRACLDLAARLVADVPGPVIEIGLGKGRTYSHLRAILPGRTIVAFDREVHAPADAQPDARHLRLGDFRETLPAAADLAGRVALAHSDFGSEKPSRDRALAAALSPHIAALMAPGGIAVADRPLDLPGFETLDPPAETAAFAYHLYRRPR